jgi:hypothetical protein
MGIIRLATDGSAIPRVPLIPTDGSYRGRAYARPFTATDGSAIPRVPLIPTDGSARTVRSGNDR